MCLQENYLFSISCCLQPSFPRKYTHFFLFLFCRKKLGHKIEILVSKWNVGFKPLLHVLHIHISILRQEFQFCHSVSSLLLFLAVTLFIVLMSWSPSSALSPSSFWHHQHHAPHDHDHHHAPPSIITTRLLMIMTTTLLMIMLNGSRSHDHHHQHVHQPPSPPSALELSSPLLFLTIIIIIMCISSSPS